MVLVDNARPERLGELVRGLLPVRPELEVLCDARRLLRAPKGATVVLEVDAEQADWLNMERPVIAHRELKLLLYCDSNTSVMLSRKAVDLFHWISHRVECPPGPWMPAVYTIRRSLCAKARGINWHGDNLGAAFRAALPDRSLTYMSATLSYADLVEAAKPSGRGWIAVTDVDDSFRARRVGWALAEAGRVSRCLVVNPKRPATELWSAHSNQMQLRDAIAKLEAAGATHPGRLASILELEPEALVIAVGLLGSGSSEKTLETTAISSPDSGAAIACLALEKGALPSDARSPPMLRASRTRTKRTPGEDSTAALTILSWFRRTRSDPSAWIELVQQAQSADDPVVLERWARRWLEAEPDQPQALVALGTAFHGQGKLSEALDVLRKPVEQYERSLETSSAEYARAAAALGEALSEKGDFAEAARLLQRALQAFEKTLGDAHPDTLEGMGHLANLLVWQNKIPEADRLLSRASHTINSSKVPGAQIPVVLRIAQGSALLREGRYSEAENQLRSILSTLETADEFRNLSALTVFNLLSQTLIEQSRYSEAETILRRGIAVAKKVGMTERTIFTCILGRALLGQGKYDKAIDCFRAVIEKEKAFGKTPTYATALHEMGRAFMAKGNYAEAERCLKEASEIQRKLVGEDHPTYPTSLHELSLIALKSERYEEAESLLRRVLAAEERISGRRHATLGITLHNLSEAISHQGRHQEAERISRRALAITKDAGNHALEAEILASLAHIQSQMGRPDAVDTAHRAVAAFKAVFGDTHPKTRSAMLDLEDIVKRVSSPKSR